MRFWKRLGSENVPPAVIYGVPGMGPGQDLVGTATPRGGRLFIVVPYEHAMQVDVRAAHAMRYLCAVVRAA